MIFLFLLIILTSAVHLTFAQFPQCSSGSIVRHENFPSKYIPSRNIDVWLPDGYNVNQRYAVLYMHDGQMLFDSATTWNGQEWGVDEIAGKLIAENKIMPCIVVGIWNGLAARHSEYFPQKPFYSLPEQFRDSLIDFGRRNEITPLFSGEVISDHYLKFIVSELKPCIDSTFSTYSDRANTFIAGSSMGGLISLYAICEYTRIFGGAACLSTHWTGIFTDLNNPIPDAFTDYLKKNLPSPQNHRIYFDHGTETIDSLYGTFQLQVDEIMRSKGYTDLNWKTLKFEGEDHSERAWSKRLDIPLVFLLSSDQ